MCLCIIKQYIHLRLEHRRMRANCEFFTTRKRVNYLSIQFNLLHCLSVKDFTANEVVGKVVFLLMNECLSVHRWSPCDHYSWYIGPHGRGPRWHQTWTPPNLAQTCSFEDLPLPKRHLLVAIKEMHGPGKWAVRILLECFLVLYFLCSLSIIAN